MESLSKRIDKGFTLIEMMVVIVIVGILMGMSVAGLSFVTAATEITGTGDHVLGQFTQARQTAIADNSHVELRLIQPQPQSDGFDAGHWIMMFVRERPDGGYVNLLPAYRLPAAMSVARGSSFSTLIDGLQEQQDAEGLIKNANSEVDVTYTAFRFNSDGSTNLPANALSDTWHITLVNREDIASADGALPSNFYTIRIDPFTGTVKSYRP